MNNPLLQDWQQDQATPFGVPPFQAIDDSHFEPAFAAALAAHRGEIDAIVAESAAPSFDNTILALERSGRLLGRVSRVFSNLSSADTNERRQAIEASIMPQLAAHNSLVRNNQALFARVQAVVDSSPALDGDQARMLADTYQMFVRGGAALKAADRERVQALDQRLAELKTRFGQNVLKDTNAFELVLTTEEELAGLPDFVRAAAAAEATERGQPGKYVVTISRSSITPFLQFSERRDLREQMYRAYTSCGKNDNEFNNEDVLREIAQARAERARLLGYNSHADYMLADRMAGSPAGVRGLLDQIWAPAQARVREEAAALQDEVQSEGGNFTLRPWDWRYYTEKRRAREFDLDEAAVKPYFELTRVRDGAFGVAGRLFGLTFTEVDDVPKYHPDVVTFEVTDTHGDHVGLLMTDYFMRPSKRGGAWMSEFRGQSNDGVSVRPVVVNCCNFPKSDPCLLGMDEVRTLFHEFGHALHGLMSRVRYESQAGTNVKQDFVELPSQIMEHWAIEPEVMRDYARHLETGAVIPDEWIDKLRASATFNEGFATTEYLAASYLDLAWHEADDGFDVPVSEFEQAAMDAVDLIDVVDPRYASTYFQHIFTGDSYSAGYYSYIWAEVLDADGFDAFKERGIFDQETADAFRENVLERGGSEDAMTLYRAFRGHDPKVGPLLANRGLA